MTSIDQLNVYRHFKTSKEAERAGVWAAVGPFKFKIARYNNPDFTSAMQVHRLRVVGSTLGEPSDELTIELYLAAMAEGIVRDWQGVTDKAGEPVPYTPELGLELLRACPDLADRITILSRQMDRYREADLGDQEKNSLAA